jgi:hypothetical protein
MWFLGWWEGFAQPMLTAWEKNLLFDVFPFEQKIPPLG